eukprot:g569.t1
MKGSSVYRSSKVRHVYADDLTKKPESCFTDLKLPSTTGDQDYIKANSTHFALAYGNGLSLAIFKLNEPTRVGNNARLLTSEDGHHGPITDFDFSPCHSQNLLASGSGDCTVKLWGWDDKETATSSKEVVKIWDVENEKEICELEGHTGNVSHSAWNHDGSLLLTTCKDRKVRIFDARKSTPAMETAGPAHEGAKTAKVCVMGASKRFVTCGFTKSATRRFKIWDERKLDSPIENVEIDNSSGVMMPFYDEGQNILYIAGKGDGNIRYYEMIDEKPHQFYINNFRSATSTKGACFVPRVALNTKDCEVARILKLTNKNTVQPLSFILPRKTAGTGMFHKDVYPDARQAVVCISAEDYASGSNSAPKYASMDPKKKAASALGSASGSASDLHAKTKTQLIKDLEKANAKIAELEEKLKKANIS